MSQSTISARIDTEDKKAFDSFCSTVGLNTSSVLNLFIKKVINEGKIPFEISVPQKATLTEGQKSFYQLREEAKNNGLQELSVAEIDKEIYNARKG